MKKIVLALVMLISTATASRAATIPWTGSSDFDNEAIAFAPFLANTLVDVTGGGYYHDHGNASTVFTLDIHLNGSWTTLWTRTGSGGDALLDTTVTTPISFALGTVDGLRLTDVPVVGNGYHGMYGSYLGSGVTTFEFDTRATGVPEPGSMLLLATGLVALAGRWRGRRLDA